MVYLGAKRIAMMAIAMALMLSQAYAFVSAPDKVAVSNADNSFEATVFNDTGSADNAVLQLFAPGIEYVVEPGFASIGEGKEQKFTITIINPEKEVKGRVVSASLAATIGPEEQRKQVILSFDDKQPEYDEAGQTAPAGFFFLPEAGEISVLDWLLIAVIAVLAVALAARAIHRTGKQAKKGEVK